jgi:putative IMPACT (imprinted ancient) family translation regulator
LLGAGGLVRAYSASARDAVAAAEIVTYAHFVEFSVKCSYSDYQKLIPIIEAFSVKEDSSEFTDSVTLRLAAKDADFSSFRAKLAEVGSGRITVTETGERFSY